MYHKLLWYRWEVNTYSNTSCYCRKVTQCERCCWSRCLEWSPFLTMFLSRTVLRERPGCPWSSVSPCWRQRGPSRSQLMHLLPFNRMQLWIFPSQRDNEVSSSAENESVVCPRGHGACGSKLNQVFVGGSISRDTSMLTVIGHQRVARLHFLPVPKDCPFSPEMCYYLTVCRFWEKVIIADCWKVSYHVVHCCLESKTIISQHSRTKWSLFCLLADGWDFLCCRHTFNQLSQTSLFLAQLKLWLELFKKRLTLKIAK